MTAEIKPREQFAPGWYKDLDNERYHGSAGWSSSKVKMLLEKTPAHLAHGMTVQEEPTAAMQLGTALHTLILEPAKFHDEFIISEKFDGRTTAGKLAKQLFEARAEGRIVISETDYERVQGMAASVLADPWASALVTDGVAESSIYWWYNNKDIDDETRYQIMTKVRPDFLPRAYSAVVDIKTTNDASYSGFIRSVEKFHYHISAAMYLEGVNQCQQLLDEMRRFACDKFLFVCVENFEPYCVATYELSEEYLAIGKAKYRACMRKLQYAMDNGWMGYDPLRVIEPPPWAHKSFVV